MSDETEKVILKEGFEAHSSAPTPAMVAAMIKANQAGVTPSLDVTEDKSINVRVVQDILNLIKAQPEQGTEIPQIRR
jgi:hypothetical protein